MNKTQNIYILDSKYFDCIENNFINVISSGLLYYCFDKAIEKAGEKEQFLIFQNKNDLKQYFKNNDLKNFSKIAYIPLSLNDIQKYEEMKGIN